MVVRPHLLGLRLLLDGLPLARLCHNGEALNATANQTHRRFIDASPGIRTPTMEAGKFSPCWASTTLPGYFRHGRVQGKVRS